MYIYRRGRDCTIMLEGWRMGPLDKLKIISEGGTCATDPATFGFEHNPAEAKDARTVQNVLNEDVRGKNL